MLAVAAFYTRSNHAFNDTPRHPEVAGRFGAPPTGNSGDRR